MKILNLKRKMAVYLTVLSIFSIGMVTGTSLDNYSKQEIICATAELDGETFDVTLNSSGKYVDKQGLQYSVATNEEGNNTATITSDDTLIASVRDVEIPYSITTEDGTEYIITSLTGYTDSAYDSNDNRYGLFYNNINIRTVTFDQQSKITILPTGTFYSCTSLTKVVLPDSLEYIYSDAFYGCKSLSMIQLPENVTTIYFCAFYNCDSLKNIVIPSSVNSIPNCCFQNCDNLQTVTIECEIKNDIPYGAGTIGVSAFYNCPSLTAVYMPDCVNTIGTEAFSGATPKIYGSSTGYAKEYAESNGFEFEEAYSPIIINNIIKGDIDGDGSVTSSDALEILRYVTNIIENL